MHKRKSKIILLSLLLFSLISPSAHAKEEKWYTFWALGYPFHNYFGALNDGVSSLASRGPTRVGVAINAFGFYWPYLSKGTLLGGNISILFDEYVSAAEGFLLGNYYVDSGTWNASLIHFFSSNIGQGLFGRVDLGIGTLTVRLTDAPAEKHFGGAVYVAGGYGLPISEETRLLLGLGYNFHQASYQRGSLIFNIGGLF